MVSDIITSSPENVAADMEFLLSDYHNQDSHTLKDLAAFHAEFEKIHPFQDGNVTLRYCENVA